MNLNHFYHYYKSKSGGVPNLLKATEDFDSSLDWLKKPDTDAPTITGGVTDPNGGTDAQRINFTANRQSRVQQSVTLSASTQYTFSVYARVNTGTDQFRLRNVTLSAAEAKTATTSWTRFEYTFTTTTGGVYELSIQNTENLVANIEFFGAMLNVGSSANNYVKVDPSTGGSAPTPVYSGFGDSFGGVTAYYSLRQFTEAETLNAIRVRRSSDDTEQDIGFDANGDLDTTALLAFVNADYNTHTSDFSSGTDGWFANGGTADGNIDGISDGTTSKDDVLRLTLSGGAISHSVRLNGAIDVGNVHDVSFEYYIPSGQTMDGILLRTDNGVDGNYQQSVVGTWTSVTIEDWSITQGDQFRIYATDGGSSTVDGDGDVFYLKNIVVTQTTADGAVTTFYDQTGNGNNATNATASEQPLVVSGGTLVTENGKAAIDFDGVDDELTIPSSTSSFNYLHNGSNAALMVVGSVVENDANLGIVVNNGRTTSKTGYVLQFEDRSVVSASRRIKSSATKSVSGQFVFTNQTADNAIDNDTQFLIIDIIDGDNATASDRSELYIDGGSAIKNNTSTNAPTSADATEDMSFFQAIDGNMQEIILFNSDQSSNRTGIESNINDHFSIYP